LEQQAIGQGSDVCMCSSHANAF